ncbi:MAG TPA: serine hydrolase domain-containing protein [Gemmatimonadaceae bacterium]|nr:serine hydrolase domain-containing protein [Gemmatimonadaceae bacterium]
MPVTRARSIPAIIAIAALAGCSARSETPRTDSAAARAADPNDTTRISRVLAGLRPPVEIEGKPNQRWTLAERMTNYKVPGVSIAVIEGGRIAWARGFGVKEAGKSDPVTPTTLFQAASISKPVAATAMLRLVERGTLNLDTNVNKYLKSWKVPDNKFTTTEKVTLRRIVSHTAGLTVHGFPGYATTDPIPTVVQVLDGAKPANTAPVRVDTTPGAIERYSGGGTTIMQQLLVDVTGKPFPALMQELVLGPVGMTSSTYEQPIPAARASEAAHAHTQDGKPIPGGWHVYPEMAPAGLWTTPTDLLKWAIAITDARAGRSTSLLSQGMTQQMLTAQKNEVGLGPFVGGTGRNFHFGHGGANEGFHSQLVMYPELGVGAAVMTNGDGGPMLISEVLRSLAAEYGWPDYGAERVTALTLDAKTVAGLVGAYMVQGLEAKVEQDSGRLMLRVARQLPEQELIPKSDTSFVMASLGWQVSFKRDASGRATAISLNPGAGGAIEGKRTK